MIIFSALIISLLSIGLLVFNQFEIGLGLSFMAYLITIWGIKTKYGYNSLLFLFLVFFGLYGYSIPISVFFELDIGWYKVAKFFYWDKVDATLFSFLIANQIALLGIIIAEQLFGRLTLRPKKLNSSSINYFFLSLIAGSVASFFEFVHFFRVGGFTAVSKGKAYYQSAVNDLVLNVPVDGFFYIAVGMFFLFIAKQQKVKWTHVTGFLFAILFYVFINMAIGERGTFLVAIAVSFLAYNFFHNVNRIKPIYIAFLGVAFLLFNVLTILREPDHSFQNWRTFIDQHGEKMIYLFNPSNTEFGAAAYNYRLYTSEEFEWKKGSTYLEIIISPLPTYIYPDKPKSILYEYRDKFNSERKEQGSIAGTGFSSLLEAYINFSYFGPFLVYFLLIGFVVFLEKIKNKGWLVLDIYYLLFFNILMIFSRSVSNYLLFKSVFYIAQIFVVFFIYQILVSTLWKTKK